MKQIVFLVILASLLVISLLIPTSMVQAQSNSAVVRAVLFYSPTCGHCEQVINGTIMPMMNNYGDQLQILAIDITQQQGWDLFLTALQKFGIERGGVPFLVFDNRYLIGSVNIPEQFPALVETYLAQGGVDWPDIPGLTPLLPTPSEPASVPATGEAESATPAFSSPSQDNATWRERFSRDPAGNTLSVIVLAGMIGAMGWGVRLYKTSSGASLKERWAWIIPILSVIGAGVAGYLAYVETAEVTAVCGPVGDCNTVQQSEYARLFGILPIGVLGLIGYAGIIIAWTTARFAGGRLADLAALALLGMTVSGTLFSIYLTFLEPFVIGATCAWCLTSAILMTALMLFSLAPLKHAFSQIRSPTRVRF